MSATKLKVATPAAPRPKRAGGAARPKPKPGLSPAQKAAAFLGAGGLALMLLSVSHCTEGIRLLTGSSWVLAALMAVAALTGMMIAGSNRWMSA